MKPGSPAKLDVEKTILDNLGKPVFNPGSMELPGTIGKISEREKFRAAKQILLGIAILYAFTVSAYLINPVSGSKLLDIITITFPPITTLILAAYFRDRAG